MDMSYKARDWTGDRQQWGNIPTTLFANGGEEIHVGGRTIACKPTGWCTDDEVEWSMGWS